jgi:2-amino-4-hydroxy-6-hydroxymethyldihydropteridine diphosphokinase
VLKLEEQKMTLNEAVLSIGSNIQPKINIEKCLQLLGEHSEIRKISSVWKTRAIGSEGPDFFNASVQISTTLSAEQLKKEEVGRIETLLGRVRSQDKNAPRTIDLDIIIFNNHVLDDSLWRCLFIALPISEIKPEIRHPKYDIPLLEIVNKMTSSEYAELVKGFTIQV